MCLICSITVYLVIKTVPLMEFDGHLKWKIHETMSQSSIMGFCIYDVVLCQPIGHHINATYIHCLAVGWLISGWSIKNCRGH